MESSEMLNTSAFMLDFVVHFSTATKMLFTLVFSLYTWFYDFLLFSLNVFLFYAFEIYMCVCVILMGKHLYTYIYFKYEVLHVHTL